MPWTEKDVEKHNKGLTDAQKKRWVAVANSVRAKCLANGGSEASCDASAIRQANGVVANEEFTIYKRKQDPNYTVSSKSHQGKNHLVVPVTMMVEGVHNGNHGPIYHSMSELGRYPDSWNGIPVVINHPTIEGISVSANHPDIIDAQTIGRVYNTWIDGNRLKAEAWIDETKLSQLSSELLEQLQAGELIEVSLGMFCDEETLQGDWNGETYAAIARNHRPDHLALLPDSVGACSAADGCGIRLNEEGGETKMTEEEQEVALEETPEEVESITMAESSSQNGTETNKQGGKDMADTTCTPCVKKKVDALISQEGSRFTEDDRARLESFDEEFLDKLVPEVLEITKEVEVNKFSEEDEAMLAEYKEIKAEKRKTMIETIQKNSKEGTWRDEELNGLPDSILEKMVGMAPKGVADYSLNGGLVQNKECEEEPLLPTGMKLKTT